MYQKKIEKIMEADLMDEFIRSLEDVLVNSIYTLDENSILSFFSDDPDEVRESILLINTMQYIDDFMEDNNI